MVCPTCQSEMKPLSQWSDVEHHCLTCGTLRTAYAVPNVDPAPVRYHVPAQAKGYAALRLALEQIAAPDPHNPGWRRERARAALDATRGQTP